MSHNIQTKYFLLMLFGLFCSVMSDVLIKDILTEYPVSETTFIRSLIRTMVVSIVILIYNTKLFIPVHIKNHLMRATLSLLTTVFFFKAYQYNSMSEVIALSYSSVIFNIILSMIILKEKVSIHILAIVLVGISGIIIAANPSHNKIFTYTSLLAIVAAVFAASNKIFVKKLTYTDSPFTIALYSSLFSVLMTGSYHLLYTDSLWVPIYDVTHITKFLLMGILSVLSQFCIINAIKNSSYSAIAPCDYIAFIFPVAADYVIWDHSIEMHVLFGSFLIIISNLFILKYRRV